KSQTQKPKIKSQNLEKIYHTNIKNIITVLQGKKQNLLESLKQEMQNASEKQQYEIAAKLRNQITGLENIFSHRFLLEQPKQKNSAWPRLRQKLQKLFTTGNSFNRIEAYDISNISGADATGSMIVFQQGAPDKNEYRKFKIKTVRGANDIAMLKEVIRRRMRRPEWQFPNMMVIDGGKPQLNAALSQLQTDNLQPKTIITALAKKEEELYIKHRTTPISLKNCDRDILHLFQAVRDEAHRFAKKYHHKLREMKIKKETR
ncbi:UvrB/UvrC motif-containing protein, partial [Patescibacteria group bacterium]|nr:UvrB/UvrC motif-containing protein [Patescibacteria group bacterium]